MSNPVNIVLLGGNGYIATAIIQEWEKEDPNAVFYALCRAGKGPLKGANIHYIACNADNLQEVEKCIPADADYMVDCIGVYTSDESRLQQFNVLPAKIMLEAARTHHTRALGYIGGSMGSKAFKESKQQAEKLLQAGPLPVVIESPTLVYGNGRHDAMSRMVPLLKFAGFFNPKLKPVLVTDLARQMVSQLLQVR